MRPGDRTAQDHRQSEAFGAPGEQEALEDEPEVSIDDASLGKLARALLAFAYEQLEKREQEKQEP